ncbi:LOB domain-containing protein 16 [Salvia hispanica]|uniref:LOB domain-containing protein 16 n=1 Tax=Salvia hispanica TaxID=49212 RepID=UPI002009188B|nr:LOB domain-containing protein 16 [Salvia hispanica]
MASGSGSPCGACKFLRRKCAAECVFAPYFCSEQGPARFAAIHKVFGASNVSKLLLHVPAADRCEAVVTIAYEAQARIRDPVYGCVAHIFALQQQVAYLQAQVMQAKAQLAQNVMDQSRNGDHNQWNCGAMGPFPPPNYTNLYSSISPQSSLDSIEQHDQHEIESRQDVEHYYYTKKRPSPTDLSELQALALRMINNQD